MGRERQKHKARSSRSKVVRKPASKKRILSNAIIAANWDKTSTLSQNYKRLGLTSRLNKTTGGIEKKGSEVPGLRERGGKGSRDVREHGLQISSGGSKGPQQVEFQEARIERDADTGSILRVVETASRRPRRLNDPLNELDTDSESDAAEEEAMPQSVALPKTEVVQKLELEAQRAEKKYVRKQSDGEKKFIEQLFARYGDDYAKMERDMQINYMQRSAGDLKRRIVKWRKAGGVVR